VEGDVSWADGHFGQSCAGGVDLLRCTSRPSTSLYSCRSAFELESLCSSPSPPVPFIGIRRIETQTWPMISIYIFLVPLVLALRLAILFPHQLLPFSPHSGTPFPITSPCCSPPYSKRSLTSVPSCISALPVSDAPFPRTISIAYPPLFPHKPFSPRLCSPFRDESTRTRREY
jgi:hypothetical protein